MITKTCETTGKTIDDAIARALAELGTDRDSVSVEVLTQPKSGFLGIGAVAAKIRVTYECEEPEPVAAPVFEAKKPEKKAAPAPVAKEKKENKENKEIKENITSARAEDVRIFLTGLFEKMNMEVSIDIREEEGILKVQLSGEKMGLIIGHRGENLDAIQVLTALAVNKGENERVRVFIDTEDYRKKREETLKHLAQRMAEKAVRTGRNVSLDPMPASERRVIHATLQEYKGVTTASVGSEPMRRVIISPEGVAPRRYNNHNNRGKKMQ